MSSRRWVCGTTANRRPSEVVIWVMTAASRASRSMVSAWLAGLVSAMVGPLGCLGSVSGVPERSDVGARASRGAVGFLEHLALRWVGAVQIAGAVGIEDRRRQLGLRNARLDLDLQR